jgi:hypothetical protein
MRLFTKEIDKKLFEQYPLGGDLSKQKVVAKIFNPYGRGTWYIINSDKNDPDYLWAIVDLFEVEVGSVSRMDLETIKVPPFRLGLERDMSFTPINAQELFDGLLQGKHYARGGMMDANAQNKAMLLNQAEGFEHHAEEFESAVKKSDEIPAWVVAKSQRASTDLSDITHYLDGENEQKREMKEGEEYAKGGKVGSKIKYQGKEGKIISKKGDMYFVEVQNYHPNGDSMHIVLRDSDIEKMAQGGMFEWQDAKIGDSALVKSENKLGVIVKDYGRKFHLRFVDGSEKTYDASELKFIKDEDEYASGGYMASGGNLESLNQYLNKLINSLQYSASKKNKEKILKEISQVRTKIKEAKEKSGNKMGDGGYMAKGGTISGEFKEARYAKGKIAYHPPKSEDKYKNREMRLAEAKGVNGKWSHREKAYIMSKGQAEKLKKYLLEGKDASSITGNIYERDEMAMGGVTFDDKVKAVKSSLLKRKKVSPSVQKDYGKTYSPKEAEESAKRIVGSLTAKERLKMRMAKNKKK